MMVPASYILDYNNIKGMKILYELVECVDLKMSNVTKRPLSRTSTTSIRDLLNPRATARSDAICDSKATASLAAVKEDVNLSSRRSASGCFRGRLFVLTNELECEYGSSKLRISSGRTRNAQPAGQRNVCS